MIVCRFYRTLHGAEVGDLFMSLIHTCELNGVNSFEYLVALQRHVAEVLAAPEKWMLELFAGVSGFLGRSQACRKRCLRHRSQRAWVRKSSMKRRAR